MIIVISFNTITLLSIYTINLFLLFYIIYKKIILNLELYNSIEYGINKYVLL